MNKNILDLRHKINKNENHSFIIGGNEVLCLNKRLVEIGVGACVAFSVCTTYGSKFNVDIRPLVGFAAVGLASILKVGGYRGLNILLLMSGIFQFKFHEYEFNGFTLSPTFLVFSTTVYLVGQVAILVSSICMLLIGLSYVVDKYGSEYMKELLDYFNNQQNRFSMGAVDIKNNLEYKFSILGRDILCLKKMVLNVGWVIGFALSLILLTNKLNEDPKLSKDPPMMLAEIVIGALVICRMLGEKMHFIPPLALLLSMYSFENYQFFCALGGLMGMIIGGGVIFTGIGFSAFALLSAFVKKSGNAKLIEIRSFINKLEDKKKIVGYDEDIKKQKAMLDKKREEVRKRNRFLDDGVRDDLMTGSNESGNKPEIVSKAEKIKSRPVVKSRGKGKDKGKDKKQLKEPIVNLNKKYVVNLSGDKNNKTWNRLFNNNKSQPDHYAIKGKRVGKLITALGGTTKPGRKNKINIYFSNQKLDNYEVHHEQNKGRLTSGFAQRVKNAIEKAITSGYIDESIVKVA